LPQCISNFVTGSAYSGLATDKLDTPSFAVDWFEEVNQLLCRGDVGQYPLLYSPKITIYKKLKLMSRMLKNIGWIMISFAPITTKSFFITKVIPTIFTITFILGSVTQLFFFKTNDWDFSYFSVLPWNIANGYGWHVPFHEIDTGIPFYAHHWQPFISLLVPIVYLFETPYALSVVHELAIGSWFFIVPYIIKIIYLERGQENYEHVILFFLLFMFFYYPLLGPWRYQTHITTLVSPAIFLSIIALHKKKFKTAFFWCVIIASGQERSAVAVFSVGMYSLLLLGQGGTGIILCSFSTLYFASVVKLLFPLLRDGQPYAFSDCIVGPYDILKKITFIFNYILYTAFLPVFGKKAFLTFFCLLPLFSMALISNREGLYSFQFQYQDISAPFVIISAIYGSLWLSEKKIVGRFSKKILVVFACIIFASSFWLSKASHPLSLIPWYFYKNPVNSVVLLHGDVSNLLQISNGHVLYVQSGIGPIISMRKDRFVVHQGNLNNEFTNSIVAISPMCDQYLLGDYETAQKLLTENPTLKLISDTGRLKIFASKDIKLVSND